MIKPFLVIQLRPENATAESEYAAFLRYGRMQENEVQRVRVEHTGLPEIKLQNFSAIIVGGSPFDVSTPEAAKSRIQKKIERDFMALFERITAIDFPFFGACSGNGLLGNYCGATISTQFSEPVGGADVTLTQEGKSDPLLKEFPETFRVLLGHKEACDSTPPGTKLLATSAACPVQMFRLGENAYATQFHPEGDVDGFRLRINVYKNHGYFPAEEADNLIAAVENEDTPIPKKILERFVRRYRVSGEQD